MSRKAIANFIKAYANRSGIDLPYPVSGRMSMRKLNDTLFDLTKRHSETIMKDIRIERRARDNNTVIDNLIQEGSFGDALFRIAKNYDAFGHRLNEIVDILLSTGPKIVKFEFKRFPTNYYTLSNDNKDRFMRLFEGNDLNLVEVAQVSDGYVIMGNDLIRITVRDVKMKPKKISDSGGFFPYTNTTKIDLHKYGIFNDEQARMIKENKIYLENCLISALKNQVSDNVLNGLKLAYNKASNIRRKDLHDISSKIGCKINLHFYSDNKTVIEKFGDFDIKSLPKDVNNIISEYVYDKTIDIALHKDHYFIYEMTEYTKFYIDHYKTLEDVENAETITKIEKKADGGFKIKRGKNPVMANSLYLVNKLTPLFKVNDLTMFPERPKEIVNTIYLDNIDNEQRIVKVNKDTIKKIPNKIVFADFESYVFNDKHTIKMLGFTDLKSDNVQILHISDFTNEKALLSKFLDIITSGDSKLGKICVYFHNLKYDLHLMLKHLTFTKWVKKDNQYYSADTLYKGTTIEFRDSYKMIPMALSEFSKSFELSYNKKEALAYTYYKPENFNKVIPVEEYAEYLSKSDRVIFYEEMNGRTTFNPTEYYIQYLIQDCLTLKHGMLKFNTIIEEITSGKCNIFAYLTVSSLTDGYMKLEGVYDDVYEVCGNLKQYINRAIYGGRVHGNEKYIKKEINEKIVDVDGCSLYPSAIKRFSDMGGIPIGKCVRYDLSTSFKDYYYGIFTVKIKAINKHQQMPMLAHKSETSIKYLNEVPKDAIYIDKFTLEDYIEYHQIEYEILDGVIWNSGANPKFGEVIERLYSTRLKVKKSKPAVGNTLKLMLNSAYGKTIIKPSYTTSTFTNAYKNIYNKETKEYERVKTTDIEDKIIKRFNTIKNVIELNENSYEFVESSPDFSYNRGHIGCGILSLSKRLINEVFGLANDNDFPIYYSDTDSIHMKYDDYPKLQELYRNKFNREMDGNQLGQFHADFNLDGAVSDIHSVGLIVLGKKSYIDKIIGYDKDGKLVEGFHYRMKGITKEGIIDTSKKYGGLYQLYQKLAKGTSIEITLNPFDEDENKQKTLFDFKNYNLSTKEEFKRIVKF